VRNWSWATIRRITLVGAALFVGSTGTAHAYIDPAAGSLLLQIIVGGVAGVGVAYRLLRHRLRDWWHRRAARSDGAPPPEVRD